MAAAAIRRTFTFSLLARFEFQGPWNWIRGPARSRRTKSFPEPGGLAQVSCARFVEERALVDISLLPIL
jgi:hypothetical protein